MNRHCSIHCCCIFSTVKHVLRKKFDSHLPNGLNICWFMSNLIPHFTEYNLCNDSIRKNPWLTFCAVWRDFEETFYYFDKCYKNNPSFFSVAKLVKAERVLSNHYDVRMCRHYHSKFQTVWSFNFERFWNFQWSVQFWNFLIDHRHNVKL